MENTYLESKCHLLTDITKFFAGKNNAAPRGEWAAREGKLGVSENSVRHNSRFRAVSVQMAAADRERITKPP